MKETQKDNKKKKEKERQNEKEKEKRKRKERGWTVIAENFGKAKNRGIDKQRKIEIERIGTWERKKKEIVKFICLI
jgi:hypothetical protein